MKIGIIGATGEVGRKMITLLEESGLDNIEPVPFASVKSLSENIIYKEREIPVRELTVESMKEKFDYLLFSAGSEVSKKLAPIAAKNGNIVIDNSSAFRRNPEIPLVVPEINGKLLKNRKGIIANPNCTTIQMVLALADIRKSYNMKKIAVSTYQSVSGAGKSAIKEFENQEKGNSEINCFPKKIHRNIIPQIGYYLEDGYTEEEEKMRFETKKILSSPDLLISPSAVRVPVIYGHSESIYCEFEQEVSLTEIKEIWEKNEALKYSENLVTPQDCEDSDYVFLSRLRYGTDKKSISFWCVADNIRVGAATNAVRIMLKHMQLNVRED
ncbi:MAG: aspartate-semialdehyde dehydrogenase [Candidatus Cloacimonadota bacterium]|nr:MAG: aspartate-semialdehyde dehydrogenase [Candidatus Cloacimonadota bacterium]